MRTLVAFVVTEVVALQVAGAIGTPPWVYLVCVLIVMPWAAWEIWRLRTYKRNVIDVRWREIEADRARLARGNSLEDAG